MHFETKFNIGDIVHNISPDNQQRFIECEFCSGKGHIFGENNESCCCPRCYGNKGRMEYFNDGWHVDQVLTIGQVSIVYRGKSNGIEHGPIVFSNYGPKSELYDEQYMCKETGIGSGILHNVGSLFETKELAQKECDKRNSKV